MTTHAPRQAFARRARRGRVVIKIGSGVLADGAGKLAKRTMRRLAGDIAPLIGAGRWPFVVSSGAIAVGMGVLSMRARPRTMPGLQAAAAAGQSKLVEAWSTAFRKYDVPVAQVLLTHADLANRRRFLNARRALAELERRKAVAIINENDTVSFEEIAFGDNDGLAADVANLVDADALILLSVAPGILDADGALIDHASVTDQHLDGVIRPGSSHFGIGGMRSKLDAARKAAARGAHVAIIDGRMPGALPALLAGEAVGTVLTPEAEATRLNSRAHWIAHTLRPSGTVAVDAGATRALIDRKKSLLPSGITTVTGKFDEGDPVDVVSKGQVIARGLSRYCAADLRRIAGASSKQIRTLLGFSLGDVVIHRDDLVVMSSNPVDG